MGLPVAAAAVSGRGRRPPRETQVTAAGIPSAQIKRGRVHARDSVALACARRTRTSRRDLTLPDLPLWEATGYDDATRRVARGRKEKVASITRNRLPLERPFVFARAARSLVYEACACASVCAPPPPPLQFRRGGNHRYMRSAFLYVSLACATSCDPATCMLVQCS